MKKKNIAISGSIIVLIIIGLIFNPAPKVKGEEKRNDNTLVCSDIKVQIIGEINKPGVYEIKSDSRLIDLVAVAGGFTSNASTETNMVQKLSDGMIIRINAKEFKEETSSKININKATIEELKTLKGIGEVTALKIVEYRQVNGPFSILNDLLKVSGISEKLFNDIINKITI